MQFIPLGKNIEILKEYLPYSKVEFCDLSIGVKYMWSEEYKIEYAVFDSTLILKEQGPDYADVFYYPMGKNVLGAIEEIEKHCKENFLDLTFCCIDDNLAERLSSRYHNASVYHEREWDDYIYTAEQFKTYAGKKLSGKRNHVNKFKKTYPNYKTKIIERVDIPKVLEFLDEYKRVNDLSGEALSELEMSKEYVENMIELEQLGLSVMVDGKIIAISVGEVVGSTLIVHIEKALTSYEGAYPLMAQEFALAFATCGVDKINREEDCGEMGLRQSKLQYRPIEIKAKNVVTVKTLIHSLPEEFYLKTKRLEITDILEGDKKRYFELYTDQELNKLWGYDYREDLGESEPCPDYFYNFYKGMIASGEERSFAIRLDGVFIGELVLHNFDFFGGVEMGFRLFSEYQKNGYALESASALKDYVFITLGAKKIKCKCYKDNLSSQKLIEKLGLTRVSEDNQYFYFEQEKK